MRIVVILLFFSSCNMKQKITKIPKRIIKIPNLICIENRCIDISRSNVAIIRDPVIFDLVDAFEGVNKYNDPALPAWVDQQYIIDFFFRRI